MDEICDKLLNKTITVVAMATVANHNAKRAIATTGTNLNFLIDLRTYDLIQLEDEDSSFCVVSKMRWYLSGRFPRKIQNRLSAGGHVTSCPHLLIE